ncbi:hypothetical protein RM572_00705 [Streptomyces sp. DSM 42041]|uniref:Uncharacterized protein n=1 Tax=Streptomyces hazeniae TaxID=3075538 RepID=A0ABU2NJX5_9ACTN|nr:hypothetical protein [Streptomyces sp. DSM 42041]MDT0377295.1 hypothetical protein [Streptomyces sp. DSM 42041]
MTANTRTIPAHQVKAGDTVLGTVITTPGGTTCDDLNADPYTAAPVPNDPDCGCPGHDALTDEDKAGDVVVLTTGYPYDCCDAMPADTPVIIAAPAEPTPRPNVAKARTPKATRATAKTPLPRFCRDFRGAYGFTHGDRYCVASRNPGAPELWDVHNETGGIHQPLASRRTTRAQAVRDAIARLDGDDSAVSGADLLAEILSF